MDKNTITAFVLIGLVFVLFTWLGRPSKEEQAALQRYNDSIAMVEQQRALEAEATSTDTLTTLGNDSIQMARMQQAYGDFATALTGNNEQITLANDSLSLTFNTRGGMISSAELKTHNDYQGVPIRPIRDGESIFNLTFITTNNRVVNTADLYFTPTRVDERTLRMALTTETGSELAFVYTLRDKYRYDMAIETKGMEQVIAANSPYLDAHVQLPIYQNEKSASTENRYSGLAYESASGDVEKLGTDKDLKEDISGSVKWIAYRDMFFSTIIHSSQNFHSVSMASSVVHNSNEGRLKVLESKFAIDLPRADQPAPSLSFYVGPNDYTLLRSIDKENHGTTDFSQVVDMGDWFRFINVYLVIPIFNFLEQGLSNYGIIILLLTLFIKLLLSPFTYKSFLSQAKMRVLRPQVEEINKKYPGEDNMMQRQKATMDLYKRAGASSLGGCLPMLLQMPFLVAMYQYFPTSINLRGESFLWANDLSTYDDVINLGFNIPFIGSHISLFCVLMTITQVVYMKISQANQPDAPGMAMMKMMPYMMSIMLFVFLNQSAAGLSYYYLLSMLISIAQTGVFRLAINEKKLLAQMEKNKLKPVKKSKFMQRLEEMQKQQIELQKQQQKKK